jgi:lysine decarboxylase
MRTAFGDRPLLLDVPLDIEGIDIGPSPTPYELAERLAAEAYEAERAWFLTNGATQGNHALCLALAGPGHRVVIQRNSHASMIDGLILSGGVPSWVAPEYDPELGLAHGVTPSRRRCAGTQRHGRRSSSRRPTTGWPPTSEGAPRWPTARASP